MFLYFGFKTSPIIPLPLIAFNKNVSKASFK